MKNQIKYAVFAVSLLILAASAIQAQMYLTPLANLRGEEAYRKLKETQQSGALAQAVRAAREQPASTSASAISPVSEVRKLWASDTNDYKFLGGSVSIAGNTAIAGAHGDRYAGGGLPKGSAYIFIRTGTTWTEQQKIFASDGMPGDNFGGDVAISGDTAIVGAWGADVNGNFNQGAAYVFVRSGTTWIEQQKIVAPDGGFEHYFAGNGVAIDGDTILVCGGGAGYVFTRSGGVWSLQQKLTVANNSLGTGVALEGDTAVISAAGENSGAGAIYVFVRSGGVWTQQQRLTTSDGAPGDDLRKVDISGDTIAASAPLDDVGANANQGSVYVFVRNGAVWTEQQKLTATDGRAGDWLNTVSISGDTIVVGSPNRGYSPFLLSQGAAFVFARSGTTWTQMQELKASDGTQGDRFGSGVAIDGNKIIAGAMYVDIGSSGGAGVGAGAVYVFVSKVSVTGRVTTAFGNGVKNAIVQMKLANNTTLMTRTSSFGYYRFDDVEADQTVIIRVPSKIYTFPQQTINITGNLTDVDFQEQP